MESRKRLALHWQILIGLLIGAVGGLVARGIWPPDADGTPNDRLEWFATNVAETAGQIFLRLIFMVVVPLVFSALTLGVAEIGDVRKLGRMGLRTLMMTLVLSGASVAIGLTLANTIRPGARLSQDARDQLAKKYQKDSDDAEAKAKKVKTAREMLLDLIPKNPLQEMVGAMDGSSPGGGMLAVMIFSLFVGAAITMAPERTSTLILVLQGVYDIAMVIIGWAMKLAPFGVAGLMFSLTSQSIESAPIRQIRVNPRTISGPPWRLWPLSP